MSLVIYNDLICGKSSLALVGLGYVGMPIAVAFAKKGLHVIGYDLNAAKIELYKSGIDPTNEVGNEVIKNLLQMNPVFKKQSSILLQFLLLLIRIILPISHR